MDYWVRLPAADRDDDDDFVAMPEAEYRPLVSASRGLRMLGHIEEAYDVVVGNYTDLEEAIFRQSVQHFANRHPWGKSDHFDTARRACHRALANLLSSARAFIDSTPALISEWSVPDTTDLSAIKTAFSRQYDQRLGYRVMEALRNHSQHYGMAVTGVGFSSGVLSPDPKDRRTLVQAKPYVHMDELRASPKFKKAVLAELEHILQPQERSEYESLEVLPFVRDHVAGLSHVLAAVRAQFADRDSDWVKNIRAAHKQYLGKLPRQGACGFDVETLNDGRRIEEVWIGDYPWSRISTLREINRPLRDPAHRLVGQ